MDIRTKNKAPLRHLVSLLPIVAASLLCFPIPSRAQSTGDKPAGGVSWYHPDTTQPTTTSPGTPNQPTQSQPAGQQPSQPSNQGPNSTNSGTGAGQSQGGNQPGQQQNGQQNGQQSSSNQAGNGVVSPNQQSTNPSTANAPTSTALPSNPLLILDPVNNADNGSAYYDMYGHLQQGRTTPEPDLGDFRGTPFGPINTPVTLPYFGYDYFQPARELIDARRNSLIQQAGLPSQPQQQTTPGQFGQNNPSMTGQQPFNTSATSGAGGYTYGQNQTQPGYGANYPQYGQPAQSTGAYGQQPGAPGQQPAGAYGQPGSTYGQPGSTYNQGGGMYGQPGPGSAYGQPSSSQPYGQQPNGYLTSPYGGYENQSGSTYGTPAAGGYPGGPEAIAGAAGGYAANTPGATGSTFPQPGYGQPIGSETTGGSYVPSYPSAGPGSTMNGGQQYGPGQTYGSVPPYNPFNNSTSGVLPYPEHTGAGFPGTQLPPPSNVGLPPQQQVDVYAGRVAGPLELMSFLPSGGAVPQTYELAGGDQLTVRIWSTTMPAEDYDVIVTQSGEIDIPGVGNFIVRGQTIDQAEHALRERIGRLFRGGDVSVTLKQQRTMVVTIAGAAYLPGSYLVPASQTAYNVLYAAGGPALDGSMRSVEIRRNGTLIGTLDLYDFLGVGGKSTDIPLQPGDVIYIPNRYSSVAVQGEVRKPAIYELKPDENLKDAFHFAGGIKASGVTQHVQVNTVDPGSARVLRDIDVKDADQVAKTPLYDGDEVDVFSVRSDVANRVSIEGAVDQVGDYALSPGMTVADLITRARGTRYNAYMKRADLYRWNADNTLTLIPVDLDKAMAGDPANNVALVRWDRLKVYGRDELTWSAARQVRVRGAVQHEGIYYRSDGMHASDLLRMAGGPLPEAYMDRVVLLHQHSDGSFTYDYLDATGWSTGDLSNDPLVLDNDVLAVYRNDEAHFTADHTVRIDGEVVSPGTYPRGDHMHVSDLVRLAGGFTPNARPIVMVTHSNKVVAAKLVSAQTEQVTFDGDQVAQGSDIELNDGDVLTVQGIGGFHNNVRLVYIDGRVNKPGPVPLMPNMRLSDLIKAAGGLLPDAFVEGTEFHRNPKLLGSASQQDVATLVGDMNDLLNQNDYQIALAEVDAERISSVAAASQPDDTDIPIPGLSSTAAAAPSGAATAAAAAAFKSEQDPVLQARKLSDPTLKPTDNLAVDVVAALRHPGDAADVLLDEGDTVVIPLQPTTVEVVGAVFNGRGVVFKPGANLDYYIAQAGGYAPDAARDRIEIIRPGGGLDPASKSHIIRAGDMILVPTKVLAAKIAAHHTALDDVLKAGLGAAVLLRLLGL